MKKKAKLRARVALIIYPPSGETEIRGPGNYGILIRVVSIPGSWKAFVICSIGSDKVKKTFP
jgi:hypothetical protein